MFSQPANNTTAAVHAALSSTPLHTPQTQIDGESNEKETQTPPVNQVVEVYLYKDDQGKNTPVLYIKGKNEIHTYDEKNETYHMDKAKKTWHAFDMVTTLRHKAFTGNKITQRGPFLIIHDIQFYNKNKQSSLPLIPSETQTLTELPEGLKTWLIASGVGAKLSCARPNNKRKEVSDITLPVIKNHIVKPYRYHEDKKELGLLYVQGKGETHAYDEKNNYYISKDKKKNWIAKGTCSRIPIENTTKIRTVGPFIIINDIQQYNECKHNYPLITPETPELTEDLKSWFLKFRKKAGGNNAKKKLKVSQEEPLSAPSENSTVAPSSSNNNNEVSSSLVSCPPQTVVDPYHKLLGTLYSPDMMDFAIQLLTPEESQKYFACSNELLTILSNAQQRAAITNTGVAQFGIFPQNIDAQNGFAQQQIGLLPINDQTSMELEMLFSENSNSPKSLW